MTIDLREFSLGTRDVQTLQVLYTYTRYKDLW